MHAQRIALGPLVHTGDSANIAYYHERDERARESNGFLYVTVLCSWIHKVDGEIRRMRHPVYRGEIKVPGEGTVAEFKYTPASTRPVTLPPRTVGRLARQALEEAR